MTPTQRAVPVVQRWVDLLAALLKRHGSVDFDMLSREVPEYGDPVRDVTTRKRMFERDKDALRAFGVPIETIGGDEPGYRLRKDNFYLPYLAVTGDAQGQGPKQVDRYGYRSLRALAFEPDELAAVSDAAARVRLLGDPVLAAHTEAAMRKLAFDLPVDAAPAGEVYLVASRAHLDPAILETLSEALFGRRVVRFDYRGMAHAEPSHREVEPWGLFFMNGNWYLAGRDRAGKKGREGLRNFRVNRMSGVKTVDARKGARAFSIPSDFRLREHARPRRAWELGEGEMEYVTVAFRAATGVTRPALELGEPVDGSPLSRRFQVRRADAFVRWLLAFAGDARPLDPPAVVLEFEAQIALTLAVYAGAQTSDEPRNLEEGVR